MNIHGLQKLTLLDYPGHTACTVFLAGCILRCPFCHNADLLDMNAEPVMDDAELLAFLRKRQGLLDGVAVTGGEPLLREESLELLRRIRELGFPVKLDTNGTHPDRLRRAAEEGLIQYCAMDLKNSPERYARTIGLKQFDLGPVRESAAFLMKGTMEYEFRTTVVREFHDDSSFRAMGEWIHGADRYFLQPFVDRDTVPTRGLSAPDGEQLKAWLEIMRPHVREAAIRGED